MSGQGLRASWECIAPYGRFIEAGKVDIYTSAGLPMNLFKNNVTFSFVDIGQTAVRNRPVFSHVPKSVMRLVNDGFITEPKPLHIFPYSKILDAFRLMQGGSHMGKIVLEPHADDVVMITPSLKPTYMFDAKATYLLSGGLGGLGRSTARWMVARGAKNLILLSRSGASRPAAKDLLMELRAAGITALAPNCDVSNKEALGLVLKDCLTQVPPIKGVIQGSMVLKDGLFLNMSIEDYYTAVHPKVRASRNLHELLPDNLDFFVLLSSASGIVGNCGQSNYCVGNTYQDALAHYCIAQGLKATSVDLGIILSVGFAVENQESMANLRVQGFNAMRESEFLTMLNALCNPSAGPATLVASQIAIGIEMPETMRIKGIELPAWMHDPMFKQLFQIRSSENDADVLDDDDKNAVAVGTLLAAAGCFEEGADLITEAMVQKLCKALSTLVKDIDSSKPLHVYGVDSLVVVELRTWFFKEVGADIAVFDIMGGSSIRELALLAARRSSFVRLIDSDLAE